MHFQIKLYINEHKIGMILYLSEIILHLDVVGFLSNHQKV